MTKPLFCLFTLSVLTGCTGPAGKPVTAVPPAWQEVPLMVAKIEGDDDAKARSFVRWVDTLAERQYFAAILESNLPLERRLVLALYRSGVRAYRSGCKREGKMLGDRATAMLRGRDSWRGNVEHEQIPYLFWRGGEREAETLLDSLTAGDVQSRAKGALLSEKIWEGGYGFSEQPVGIAAAVEAALHRAALAQKNGKAEDARSWYRFATNSAASAYPLERPMLNCRIVGAVAGWMDTSELTPLVENAVREMEGLPKPSEERGLLRVEAAGGWRALGRMEEAASLLRVAEEEARAVPAFYRPMVLAKIGSAWFELGRGEEAEAAWLQAADTAHRHVHPRARLINAAEVLLALGSVNQVPSPKVRSLLDAIARGEAGEVDYGPGWQISGQAEPAAPGAVRKNKAAGPGKGS